MKIEAATRLKAGRETGEGAGAIFYCPETENFLILKRSDEGDAGGTWCGLGGGRDNDDSGKPEPLHETVRREAWEEAQFDRRAACELRYIGCLKHPDGFKFHNYLGIVPEEFTPVLNEEHSDYQWCRWNGFPKEMHPGMMAVLNSPDGRQVLEEHTTAFM